jgi:hypothetical protein
MSWSATSQEILSARSEDIAHTSLHNDLVVRADGEDHLWQLAPHRERRRIGNVVSRCAFCHSSRPAPCFVMIGCADSLRPSTRQVLQDEARQTTSFVAWPVRQTSHEVAASNQMVLPTKELRMTCAKAMTLPDGGTL